jgi:F-type H+-transporting ATPase subunit delta
MLKSPVISADKKNAIFLEIFGKTWNTITRQFITLLTNKGREAALYAVCIAFIEQYKNLHKIRPATIITALEMTPPQLEEMKSKFKHWLHPDETMELTQEVDPTLIGGFIISMGDKYYDSSVKRQLGELKENLYDKSYINLVEKS